MLFFLPIFYELSLISFIYINCVIQDLQIMKLPYLSINNNTENLYLRKLSFPSDIYGSAFGLNYYYTNLYLGENLEKQTYILDTGSSITTSPCTRCTKCGKHLNNYFYVEDTNNILCNDNKCKIVRSSCGSQNRCSFQTSYSEGSSLEGVFVTKLINFDDNDASKGKYAPIGCTTSETHLFLTQKADGIMGLANNEYHFISIMNKVGALDSSIFGLCLAQKGGYFSIGEIDTTFHKEKISYIKMERSSMFYAIGMQEIYVGDKKIKSFKKSKYQVIIDSGTTISYFPKEVFNEIVEVTNNICNSYTNKNACGKYDYDKDLGPCFIFDDIEKLENGVFNYWPNFTFILNNKYNFHWIPKNYYFNDTSKKKARACMGFNHQSWKFTMGSTWMIGHDIIFDIKNQKIGFAQANCDKNNDNRSIDDMGIEDGYKFKNTDNTRNRNIFFDFFVNENMLGFYIFVTIILFFAIIYLVSVLINIKKRKKNPWMLFGKRDNISKNETLIPIRYDVNDTNENENNKSKKIDMIYLKDGEGKKEIQNSKYSKINT